MITSKVTTVQKDSSIRPAVVHNPNEYKGFDNKDMNDPAVIDGMVRAIAELDKESHAEIYLTIRKFRSRKFFAANNLDTRFNVYALNERERLELDHTIELCRINMQRKSVLESAGDDHRTGIQRLDETLVGAHVGAHGCV